MLCMCMLARENMYETHVGVEPREMCPLKHASLTLLKNIREGPVRVEVQSIIQLRHHAEHEGGGGGGVVGGVPQAATHVVLEVCVCIYIGVCVV